MSFRPPLAADQIEKAVALHVAGKTTREIAKVLGSSCGTVSRTLRARGGVSKRQGGRRQTLNSQQQASVIERYADGSSYDALAKRFDVSVGCVRGVLTRWFVQARCPPTIAVVDRRGRQIEFQNSFDSAMGAYLDANNVDWHYRTTMFGFDDATKFTPAFLIYAAGKANHYIDIAGWVGSQRICQWEKFHAQYDLFSWEIVGPAELADMGALEPVWGTHPQAAMISELRKRFTKTL